MNKYRIFISLLLESHYISVITVTFNNLNGLKETINSFLESTYQYIELIIIDGDSEDGTKAYLETIKTIPNHKIKIISEKDNGIYDAMNKGILHSNGEWIVFMNSGDTFYKSDTLDSLDPLFKNKNCHAFYGNTEVNYTDFSRIHTATSKLNYWKSLPFIHQSFYCRKELLIKHPFNQNYKICADYEFYLWLLSNDTSIQYINKTLSSVSSGGASDKSRQLASLEKLSAYKSIFNHISVLKSLYFYCEFLKGIMATFIKSILPKSLITYITKFKYNI